MTVETQHGGPAGSVTHVPGPAGRLAVREQLGDGVPLLLVHGINMHSLVWEDVVARLPGRRILALDLRGHGMSDQDGPFSVDAWTADVRAVMDGFDLQVAQLAGVSLGGMIVALIAQETPDRVQSLLLLGSAIRVEHPDLDGGMRRLRGVGTEAYFAGASPLRDANPITRRLAGFAASPGRSVETVEAVTRAGFATDLTGRLRPSGRPAIVASGELDRTCTPPAGRALAKAIGGSWRLVAGVGHVIPVEAPELCASYIEALEGGQS